ncbi:hypothetical protein KAH94_00330, partial [bacterium]|nr:hypothetical protein [bacterium]
IPFVALIGVSNSYAGLFGRLIGTNMTIVGSSVAHTSKTKPYKVGSLVTMFAGIGTNVLSTEDEITGIFSLVSSGVAYSAGREMGGYLDDKNNKNSKKRDRHLTKFASKVLIANGITILGSIFSFIGRRLSCDD